MGFKMLVMLILFSSIAAADNLAAGAKEITAQTGASAVVEIKEGVNYKPQLDQHTKEIEALKISCAALEKIQKELSLKLNAIDKANDNLLAEMKKMDASLKIYIDKTGSVEKSIEDCRLKLTVVNESLDLLKKKNETDGEAFEKLKGQLESFKLKLEIARDDIKVRSDESKAIKESLTMMKNNIDSNVTDTIEIKRQLRELSAKPDTKIDKGILGWENWGPLAAGIGAIALIIAIAK